jgi:prepilin-type N-terminal cleavage/methylation domain-containing protein
MTERSHKMRFLHSLTKVNNIFCMSRFPTKKSNTFGFTLIEIIVALSIFSVAAITITSSFIAINKARREAQEKEDILNQLRFAIDLIGQEILSGSAFPDPNATCKDGITLARNGCSHFLFASKVRPEVPLKRLEYCFNATADLTDGCPGPEIGILKRAEQKSFGVCQGIVPPECFLPFTSSRTTLNSVKFFVDHKADNLQPIVTISLDGTIREETFRISASYSPRLLQDPFALPPIDSTPPVVRITAPVAGNSTSKTSPYSIGLWTAASLGGNASDTNLITKMTWKNRTNNNRTGNITITPSTNINWNTMSISVIPNVANQIVVEAIDAEGNSASDTIWLSSAANLGAPTVNAGPYCSPTGTPGIRLQWNSVSGASEYHIYRCVAPCNPASLPEPPYRTDKSSPYIDTAVVVGTNYSYAIRAHNHAATPRVLGPTSNIVQSAAAACTRRYYQCVSNTCQLTVCPGGVCPANQCSSQGATCGITSLAGTFTISATPQYIRAGVSGSVSTRQISTQNTIRFSVTSGTFTENVTLSVAGGPPGMTPRFIDNATIQCSASPHCTVGNPQTRQFLVQIPDNTPVGPYNLTITANGGGKRASTVIVLDVFPVGGGQK